MSIGQTLESGNMRQMIRERDDAIRALQGNGVTVVIPCFEQQEWLEQSLGSVLAQTVPPLEVLIIDDGSRRPIVAPDHPTVRVIRVANRGLPSARNVGLMNAHGHAFLPLDADDWIEPTFIEKTLPLLDAGADVVMTGLQEHGERTGLYMPGCDLGLDGLTVEAERMSNRLFYCNTPEAPIWMGDMTFSPLGDVRLGDEVIGWSDYGGKKPRQQLQRAVVTGISARPSTQVVRVTMESGRELRCTSDHRWLSYHRRPEGGGRPGKGYLQGQILQDGDSYVVPEPGRTLVRVIDPVTTTDRDNRVSGYLAGLYDGEGTGNTISQSEDANADVCSSLRRALAELSIAYTETQFGSKCRIFHIVGGRQQYVEFVNRVGPTRVRSWDRKILTTKFRIPDRVISVTPDGYSEVISLQTTTGNYVAWGYASKNCSLFRTQLLRDAGGYNGRMIHGYEDWDLWVDVMQRGAKFSAVNEPLFNYRTRRDSMLADTERNHRDWCLDEMARHHGYSRPQPPARGAQRLARQSHAERMAARRNR